MLKLAIVVLLFAVIISLFSGLFFLIRDGGKTNRVVNSLAVRVSLSVLLLAVVLIYLLSMILIPSKTHCQQQQWITLGSGIHRVPVKDCNLVDL